MTLSEIEEAVKEHQAEISRRLEKMKEADKMKMAWAKIHNGLQDCRYGNDEQLLADMQALLGDGCLKVLIGEIAREQHEKYEARCINLSCDFKMALHLK